MEPSEVAQLCPTLCNSKDSNLPGSSVHEILQARILMWVAISPSRGSSQAKGSNGFFATKPPGKPIYSGPMTNVRVWEAVENQRITLIVFSVSRVLDL